MEYLRLMSTDKLPSTVAVRYMPIALLFLLCWCRWNTHVENCCNIQWWQACLNTSGEAMGEWSSLSTCFYTLSSFSFWRCMLFASPIQITNSVSKPFGSYYIVCLLPCALLCDIGIYVLMHAYIHTHIVCWQYFLHLFCIMFLHAFSMCFSLFFSYYVHLSLIRYWERLRLQ